MRGLSCYKTIHSAIDVVLLLSEYNTVLKKVIDQVCCFSCFFVDMAAPPAIGFEGLQEPAQPYEAIGKFSSYQIILKGVQDVVKIIGRS